MNQIYQKGQLVDNRDRLWRVDHHRDDVLEVSSIDGTQENTHQFYLPVEDVSLASLPAPDFGQVGDLNLQELLIQAYRLSILHGSAPLLSLQQSRIIPTSYQFVPVIMALEMPRVRMLLADDVGLGKTIEAGLIIKELMARNRVERILFLTPASLREQWKETLSYYFHLDVPIISTRHKRYLDRELPPGVNHWSYFPRLISSISYAKQDQYRHEILQQDWDLVVMDEAHLAAKPHQSSGNQSVNKIAWDFALELAEHVPNLLLLSATPHNGFQDSFASLLHLLDPEGELGLLDGPLHEPHINKQVAKNYVCQRRRRDVVDSFARRGEEKPFPDREQSEEVIDVSEEEERAITAVEELGRKIVNAAREDSEKNRVLAGWIQMHFHKRALSSPRALQISLENRLESIDEYIEEQLDVDPSLSLEEAMLNTMDGNPGDHLSEEEATFRQDRTLFGELQTQKDERDTIQKALNYAKNVSPKYDNKLQYLANDLLPDWLDNSPPTVIVFTRYVDTLEYLEDKLPEYCDKSFDLFTVHGGDNESKRREIFRRFRASDAAVLVSTDCIAEGVNLQEACAQVVHYELPWNPNRLEQRNGRVDRFGQEQPLVRLQTLVMDDTLDAAILETLIEKATQIHRDYGFSPPYFSEGTEVFDLIKNKGMLNNLQEEKQMQLPFYEEEDTEEDPFGEQAIQRIQEDCFYGQETVDLDRVHERIRATEEKIGSPEKIQAFLDTALSKLGGTIEETGTNGIYKVQLNDPRLTVIEQPDAFEATFDPERGYEQEEIDVLDLAHPLMQRVIELIKQETFDTEGDYYGRTAAKVNREAQEVTAMIWGLARFVIQSEPTSVVEELIPIQYYPYSDRDTEINPRYPPFIKYKPP